MRNHPIAFFGIKTTNDVEELYIVVTVQNAISGFATLDNATADPPDILMPIMYLEQGCIGMVIIRRPQ
jgi:hypothetical protein